MKIFLYFLECAICIILAPIVILVAFTSLIINAIMMCLNFIINPLLDLALLIIDAIVDEILLFELKAKNIAKYLILLITLPVIIQFVGTALILSFIIKPINIADNFITNKSKQLSTFYISRTKLFKKHISAVYEKILQNKKA